MVQHWTDLRVKFKTLFILMLIPFATVSLGACSVNPATGQQQFTALMSPSQENKVGAQEHQNVIKQFGLYNNQAVTNFVSQVGQKVTQNTERPDVRYKFFVVDSPIVNAFALPGGYIYVSRGLLALANSESELAGVLGHEAGHITGRHSAERYSTGVVTALGAAVLAAALGSDTASQAFGVGSDLFIKSYSRGQESEADSLGIRYLSRAGYDTKAMAGFLANLQADSALQGRIRGNGGASGSDFFSTHPATADRVAQTRAQAAQYPGQGRVNRDVYLRLVEGLVYGDSEEQGFIRGRDFYHTKMGFTFRVPDGFSLVNQPSAVVATSKGGAAVLFDMAAKKDVDPATFLTQIWMKDKALSNVERITVNGFPAASAGFQGNVNGKPMTIRLVAIEWRPDTFARFQIAIPGGVSSQLVEELKRTTYSFRGLSTSERNAIKPYSLRVVTAKSGDSVASLARRMPFHNYQEERFRVLNGLKPGQGIQAGVLYKIVKE